MEALTEVQDKLNNVSVEISKLLTDLYTSAGILVTTLDIYTIKVKCGISINVTASTEIKGRWKEKKKERLKSLI